MVKRISLLIGCSALAAAISFPLLSYAQEQIIPKEPQQLTPKAPQIEPVTPTTNRPSAPQTNFEGRGIAHGSTFAKGRNANVTLNINQGRFVFNLAEPPGTRARVRYQGVVARQNNTSSTPNSFTLDGRVQTFDSSASTRIFNNTTGTCRIEVFNARVISSNCRSASSDSATQFLGLERF